MVFGVVALAAFALLEPVLVVNGVVAGASGFVLSGLGKPSQYYVDGGGVPHLHFEGGVLSAGVVDAEFSGLCSGKLELAVLLGVLVASRDRSWAARVLGFLCGVVVVFCFNVFRVVASLLASGSAWLGLVHDFLFRASLVLVVVVFYWAWYSWLSRTRFFGGAWLWRFRGMKRLRG
ncbi:MAG: hypothetical protein ACP5IG_03605 [Candidatus Micrarchaeia archaeon]